MRLYSISFDISSSHLLADIGVINIRALSSSRLSRLRFERRWCMDNTQFKEPSVVKFGTSTVLFSSIRKHHRYWSWKRKGGYAKFSAVHLKRLTIFI